MNTAHPLAATLAQIHRLSLDGTLAEITPLADQALALLEKEAGTPSSRWASAGEPDPHGTTYDCERAALALGDMTDDELANAVFLHGDSRPSTADLISGKALLPSAYLTAAKDRIRWLSRKLQAALPTPNPHEADRNG